MEQIRKGGVVVKFQYPQDRESTLKTPKIYQMGRQRQIIKSCGRINFGRADFFLTAVRWTGIIYNKDSPFTNGV